MRRFARLLLAVLLAPALALVFDAPAPAGADTSFVLDVNNRASAISGLTNGQLPASVLSGAAPNCVVYSPAAGSLIAMMAAAHRAGVKLLPAECYRDYAGQVAARESWCARGACEMAAVPGTSNHGWAKAADFNDQSGSLDWGSPGYLWMKANAWRYGWIHPAVMEPGGSVPEPWHWEWVGDGGRLYPGTGYGESRGVPLPGDGWPGGSFDLASDGGASGWFGTMRVAGWAIDPNTSNPIDVHVWVDNKDLTVVRANKPRADVAELLAGYDASPHGFDADVPALYGRHSVCAYAINAVGAGGNNLLGCKTTKVGTQPIGSLDSVSVGIGGAMVRGWAIDADTDAAINVQTFIDGIYVGTTTANTSRPDVGGVFPGSGPQHGYEALYWLGEGAHTVCTYAVNVGAGSNQQLGCQSLTVSSRNPFGFLDIARPVAGGIEVQGWAIDPDSTAALTAHVYVDGVQLAAVTANGYRPDVGAAFRGYGDNHGYITTVAAGRGSHSVCVYVLNVGPGNVNPLLGCKNVSI